jgi:hypothetical protein
MKGGQPFITIVFLDQNVRQNSVAFIYLQQFLCVNFHAAPIRTSVLHPSNKVMCFLHPRRTSPLISPMNAPFVYSYTFCCVPLLGFLQRLKENVS